MPYLPTPLRFFIHTLLAITALWLSAGIVFAYTVQEYAAKSVLSLNLARYSDWPPELFIDGNNAINLCVMGDETVQHTFTAIDQKNVGEKKLSVLPINNDNQLQQCHLLFVSADQPIAQTIFDESINHHILTIGETDVFLEKGGMVYLETVDNKINLNINLNVARKAGVQISARVLKLATIYEP